MAWRGKSLQSLYFGLYGAEAIRQASIESEPRQRPFFEARATRIARR